MEVPNQLYNNNRRKSVEVAKKVGKMKQLNHSDEDEKLERTKTAKEFSMMLRDKRPLLQDESR